MVKIGKSSRWITKCQQSIERELKYDSKIAWRRSAKWLEPQIDYTMQRTYWPSWLITNGHDWEAVLYAAYTLFFGEFTFGKIRNFNDKMESWSLVLMPTRSFRMRMEVQEAHRSDRDFSFHDSRLSPDFVKTQIAITSSFWTHLNQYKEVGTRLRNWSHALWYGSVGAILSLNDNSAKDWQPGQSPSN